MPTMPEKSENKEGGKVSPTTLDLIGFSFFLVMASVALFIFIYTLGMVLNWFLDLRNQINQNKFYSDLQKTWTEKLIKDVENAKVKP